MNKLKLGVNIDHVATLRQARLGINPSPLAAAKICELAGADGITAHLREDRRHIQDADMLALSKQVKCLNMEMAVTEEMLHIVSDLIKPANCCLVPEKRRELTTEGGLDAAAISDTLKQAMPALKAAGIAVSLFIAPEEKQIETAKLCGAGFIELHTGAYANAPEREKGRELARLAAGAELAHKLGLGVNAGHGIDYENIGPLLKEVPFLHELNIGHSIIARAVFTGLENAVKEMLEAMQNYHSGEN